jgi:hypothetical protein
MSQKPRSQPVPTTRDAKKAGAHGKRANRKPAAIKGPEWRRLAGLYASFAKELDWLAAYGMKCFHDGRASKHVPGGLVDDAWRAILARDKAQMLFADRTLDTWTAVDELSATLATVLELSKVYDEASRHIASALVPKMGAPIKGLPKKRKHRPGHISTQQLVEWVNRYKRYGEAKSTIDACREIAATTLSDRRPKISGQALTRQVEQAAQRLAQRYSKHQHVRAEVRTARRPASKATRDRQEQQSAHLAEGMQRMFATRRRSSKT